MSVACRLLARHGRAARHPTAWEQLHWRPFPEAPAAATWPAAAGSFSLLCRTVKRLAATQQHLAMCKPAPIRRHAQTRLCTGHGQVTGSSAFAVSGLPAPHCPKHVSRALRVPGARLNAGHAALVELRVDDRQQAAQQRVILRHAHHLLPAHLPHLRGPPRGIGGQRALCKTGLLPMHHTRNIAQRCGT